MGDVLEAGLFMLLVSVSYLVLFLTAIFIILATLGIMISPIVFILYIFGLI